MATLFQFIKPWRGPIPFGFALQVRDASLSAGREAFVWVRWEVKELEGSILEFDSGRAQAKLAGSGQPWVTLKAAVTLDGKIATAAGESKWITGEAARRVGHELRALHDAVLVGINTVLADDPRLTVRLAGKIPSPARIVLDSRGRLPEDSKFLAHDGCRKFVIVGRRAPLDRIERLRNAGATVFPCNTDLPMPEQFFPWLKDQGLETILVEGGGSVHGGLIAAGLADELFLFISGRVIGDPTAPGWCGELGLNRLSDTPRISLSPPRSLGQDILIHGLFQNDGLPSTGPVVED